MLVSVRLTRLQKVWVALSQLVLGTGLVSGISVCYPCFLGAVDWSERTSWAMLVLAMVISVLDMLESVGLPPLRLRISY